VTTDPCIATPSAIVNDDDNAIGGCSITHADGGAIVAILALLRVRRRRPSIGHARPSPGQTAR
jgi:hypothetical protein